MRHASSTVIASLPILFLALHAGTLVFVRDGTMEISFFWLIAAPVTAGAVCLLRGGFAGSRDGF
ncbi:MAG TPA: GGDEF domain-containing protein, partial [Novosphingobium sp.]|nr:GGDEF domain-containing protein [Novosphingobium sp.]